MFYSLNGLKKPTMGFIISHIPSAYHVCVAHSNLLVTEILFEARKFQVHWELYRSGDTAWQSSFHNTSY